MTDELRGLFPRRWILDGPDTLAIVEIYVDWLLQEIDMLAEQKWPILKTMRGHRRSEIIAFLEAMGDWTKDIHI